MALPEYGHHDRKSAGGYEVVILQGVDGVRAVVWTGRAGQHSIKIVAALVPEDKRELAAT